MAEGLVTLTTDLKSLKYNSMPLGSEKPYVTKNIGQAPQSQLGLQVSRRVDDLSRISQMLIDKPGLKFIGNQALLQQTDSLEKLQKASDRGLRGIAREGLQIAKNTVIGTAKILGSTLAQVPVNGTGTHFVYGFRTDTYLQPANQGPITAFASFFGKGGVEGAQYALRGEPVPNSGIQSSPNGPQLRQTTATPGFIGISNQNITGSLINPADELGIEQPNSSDLTVNSPYLSEKSYNGEGLYQDIRAEDSARTEKSNFFISPESGAFVSTNLGIAEGETNKIKPYFRETPDKDSPTNTYSTKQQRRKLGNSLKDARRETRINLGDQGAINVDNTYQEARRTNNYTISSSNKNEVDKLNALDIQSSERADGIDDARDLAKFFFEIITPDSNRFINFRAFITSMDDSYTGNWESKRYVGRGDEFYTYGGFSRDINIGFKIAAATRSEMKPLYRKMVLLASSTAPTYGEYKFMRGTFVRLSLGSYFNQIPGVLTSVKYTWNTDYPWEIALSEPEAGEGGVQELPMVMDCSISFKPVHDFVPQTGLYNYITSKDKQIFFKNGDQI